MKGLSGKYASTSPDYLTRHILSSWDGFKALVGAGMTVSEAVVLADNLWLSQLIPAGCCVSIQQATQCCVLVCVGCLSQGLASSKSIEQCNACVVVGLGSCDRASQGVRHLARTTIVRCLVSEECWPVKQWHMHGA